MHSASKAQIRALLDGAGAEQLNFLNHHWPLWARPDQLPPENSDWVTWILLGGRGAGKTRAGAEWIRANICGPTPLAPGRCRRAALVAETLQDARDIMIEGISGLLAVHPYDQRPRFESSNRRLIWPNGAIAQVFSSEDPESLRGPQFDIAWADELAKWTYPDQTWDMLQFGLRLGERPQQVVTTTPRPIALLKKIIADNNSIVTRSTTYDNKSNLAASFLDAIITQYKDTRLGRQELNGELLEDQSGALWNYGLIDRARVRNAPALARIVIAVDPPITSHNKSNACGIIIAGLSAEGHGYVIEDATVSAASPLEWARLVVARYNAYEADCIVVETNQGGEMVTTLLHQVDANAALRPVHATTNKRMRAEPIAAFYEQNRIHHVGAFPDLEDEMCAFEHVIKAAAKSPDRVDALVWALSNLMLAPRQSAPKIRPV